MSHLAIKANYLLIDHVIKSLLVEGLTNEMGNFV